MERGALHSCLLEITNVCNFRCPHCYVDKKMQNIYLLKMSKYLRMNYMN